MTGDADDLIRVAVPDMAALECLIIEHLSAMPEVEKNPLQLCAQTGAVHNRVAVTAAHRRALKPSCPRKAATQGRQRRSKALSTRSAYQVLP